MLGCIMVLESQVRLIYWDLQHQCAFTAMKSQNGWDEKNYTNHNGQTGAEDKNTTSS